jgi:predicted methyltransferase
MTLTRTLIVVYALFSLLTLNAYADGHEIDAAVKASNRSSANVARDVYRHPKETLQFFDITPSMKVLEILPGRGWYTEILAPYLAEKGHLTVASFGVNHRSKYAVNVHKDFVKKIEAEPNVYGKVDVVLFQEDSYLKAIPDASMDMVVTFRNSHNWIRFGGGIEEVYAAFSRVLKPGGILGVVQHRAAKGSDPKASAEKGYIPKSYLIDLVEKYSFELMGSSEINANPKDTRDHPEGVWTLPPSYRLKDVDKDKYAAIGESDRMTLRFVKK